MIDRYTRPEMGHIFSLENKYAIWQEIEVLACEAHAEMGKIGITREEAAWIREHAKFNKEEVDAIEAVTNHDVIAFLTNMGEYIDAEVPEGEPKPSRWVHYGMTSSDLGDTALCYQLVQATDIIIEDVRKLGEICRRRAFEERETLCVGRTHGIHAEPMTFGMKFGSWAWELKRDLDRLLDARKNVAFGAISGAVGTYSSIDPFVEEYVCERLGLAHDPLSTQVISRDHHAYLAGVLATTAATCDRIATEIRNLQKTDTLEAEEPFKKGQKGSSAMPHKRNPITLEKVCGLSRVVKANAQVAFDNVALWHERDISHSSAERVAQADSFIALDHMLNCLIRIVDALSCTPRACRRTSTSPAASSSLPRSCWPWSTPASPARTPTRSSSATPWRFGTTSTPQSTAPTCAIAWRQIPNAPFLLRSWMRFSIPGISSPASTWCSSAWKHSPLRSKASFICICQGLGSHPGAFFMPRSSHLNRSCSRDGTRRRALYASRTAQA